MTSRADDEAAIRLLLQSRANGVEERDLIVRVGDGLGFSSSLQRRADGGWERVTLAWRRLETGWTVVHRHAYRCSGGMSRMRAECAAISSAV